MSVTLVGDVSNQVQKFWGGVFMDELMETALLPSLVNKDYEGEIKQGGDTVYVSQINRPTATKRTVGTNHDTFEASQLSTSRVSLVADTVFSAAYEFDSLVQLQSQIGDQDSKIRKALLEALEIAINTHVFSIVAPSTSSPDHSLASVSTMDAAQVLAIRQLAATAKWSKTPGWFMLLDPSYYNDVLAAATLTSRDYVGDDLPVVGGQEVLKRFGFNILEDNSAGMLTMSPASAGAECGLAFHPDWCHLVLGAPEFEVSSTHANKRFGYMLSVRVIGGAALGISGANKHVKIYNT